MFTFPVLDNGYVYLAATRLSLYRADTDWAMVIEVFGYSPRSCFPDNAIYTFANRLHGRNPPESYVSREAYEKYLVNNPHNELRMVYPIDEGDWQDRDDPDYVAANARHVHVRGKAIALPPPDEYIRHGIELEDAPRVRTAELCRYLAATVRADVLATDDERRVSLPPHLTQLLQLDEWHHPDIAGGERPGRSATFRQLANVLETGDVSQYQPVEHPNTHWSNWPDAGTL